MNGMMRCVFVEYLGVATFNLYRANQNLKPDVEIDRTNITMMDVPVMEWIVGNS